MTFHQVEYFLAVAKYLNFSLAADEVFISQSTLSNQVKKLEEELGVSLFVRDSRSVRLTPAGEDFLLHARHISAEVVQSKEKMQEYTSYQRGHLRIGFAPAMAYFGMQKVVADFTQQYNNVEVRFFSDSSDSLLKGMREKKSMLAFVTAPFSTDNEVDFHPLYCERSALLVSRENPLALQPEIDITEILTERFLISSVTRHHIDELYSQYGINLRVVLDSDDVYLLKCMAEAGLGVAVLGERVAAMIAGERCVAVPLVQKLVRQHGLAIPNLKRLPLSTRAFRDFVLKRFEQPLPDKAQ